MCVQRMALSDSSHRGLLLDKTSDDKKRNTVVVRDSKVTNRGHTGGQAMSDNLVQGVSSIVGQLLSKIHIIQLI